MTETIQQIEADANKTIEDMRQAFIVRGLDKVPHSPYGWGLGSELDYLMRSSVIPAVTKQKLENIAAVRKGVS